MQKITPYEGNKMERSKIHYFASRNLKKKGCSQHLNQLKRSRIMIYTNSSWLPVTSKVYKSTSENGQRRRREKKPKEVDNITDDIESGWIIS